MVALWNLVKNGGDLYSAILNHIKPIHIKLNGKGKVLLRGIHTTFYQIYQTVRIWTTIQVLSNPAYKIELYSDLQAVVTNTMPKFRQLVRDIALEIKLDLFKPAKESDPTLLAIQTPATSPTKCPTTEVNRPKSLVHAYKKAACFVVYGIISQLASK